MVEKQAGPGRARQPAGVYGGGGGMGQLAPGDLVNQWQS